MSYKTFQNGFPLPASDLNNYLMNQVVATFANSAARSSAIAAPQEGQVTYLENDDKYYRWNGSAWVELAGMTSQVSQALSPNYIINGAFDFWQRGTTTSGTGPVSPFTADRWQGVRSAGQLSTSQQTTVPTGFTFALRVQRPNGDSNTTAFSAQYTMETRDSRLLIGNSVTFSFWARCGANYSPTSSILNAQLKTGTGTDQSVVAGFTGEVNAIAATPTLTTDWQRFSYTTTLSSSVNQLGIRFVAIPTGTASTNDWFEITGVQLEAGSVATPFRRNANSLQGELAACQRYYQVISGFSCSAPTTNAATTAVNFKTEMRTAPSVTASAAIKITDGTADYTQSSASAQLAVGRADTAGAQVNMLNFTGLTQFRAFQSTILDGKLIFAAEL